jgi:hypothetical protein
LVEEGRLHLTENGGDGCDLGTKGTRISPPRLEPDDRRCQSCAWRTTCQGEALVISGEAEYEQDESLADLVREHQERAALKKEAVALYDETTEELKSRLGDRGKVAAAGAKIQFYTIHKKEYVVKAHDERPLKIYPRKSTQEGK